MNLGFTGQYPIKVDGKGRMSIPAAFRRVLEDEDPDWSPGQQPRAILLFGPHLRENLQVYSVEKFLGIRDEILGLPKGSERKRLASKMILSNSLTLDVDKDGRVVLPQAQRDKLGLTEGELKLAGMGDHFEIWRGEAYEAADTEVETFLAAQDQNFDPLSLLGT